MENTPVRTLHGLVEKIRVNSELSNSVTRADVTILREMRCTGHSPPRALDVKAGFTTKIMAETRRDRDQQRNSIPGHEDISRKGHPRRKSKTTGHLLEFWARRLERWTEAKEGPSIDWPGMQGGLADTHKTGSAIW